MIHASRIPRPVAVVVCLVVASAALAAGSSLHDVPGYVDGSKFIETAGDDSVRVEVNLHGALLKALTKWDPELSEMVGGLESIHAVVIDLGEGPPDGVLAAMRATERRLLGSGWARIARVAESDTDLKVMVLNDEEVIRGLVVMVVDHKEKQMIFTNIAGVIDLGALETLGDKLDLPGLGDLE